MIDLDEFTLCTHEKADMMIFVHTNYATKEGGPEGVLVAKASDTDIICIAVSMMSAFRETGLHQLWIACGPASTGDRFLSMNCAHWATEEQGHSHLMLCLPSATKERRCDVCDKITDVFHKLSQFPLTVIDDDMEMLCRFVSECMTGPAQLTAAMMQDWRCLQEAVTRRVS